MNYKSAPLTGLTFVHLSTQEHGHGLNGYFQCLSCQEGGNLTNQDVSAGNAAEPQVLHGSLLKLDVSVAELAVGAQDILDRGFDLWKQVNELDVGGQQQRPSRHRAQVKFGVQKVELDQRAGGGGEDKDAMGSVFSLNVSGRENSINKSLIVRSNFGFMPCLFYKKQCSATFIGLIIIFNAIYVHPFNRCHFSLLFGYSLMVGHNNLKSKDE